MAPVADDPLLAAYRPQGNRIAAPMPQILSSPCAAQPARPSLIPRWGMVPGAVHLDPTGVLADGAVTANTLPKIVLEWPVESNPLGGLLRGRRAAIGRNTPSGSENRLRHRLMAARAMSVFPASNEEAKSNVASRRPEIIPGQLDSRKGPARSTGTQERRTPGVAKGKPRQIARAGFLGRLQDGRRLASASIAQRTFPANRRFPARCCAHRRFRGWRLSG